MKNWKLWWPFFPFSNKSSKFPLPPKCKRSGEGISISLLTRTLCGLKMKLKAQGESAVLLHPLDCSKRWRLRRSRSNNWVPMWLSFWQMTLEDKIEKNQGACLLAYLSLQTNNTFWRVKCLYHGRSWWLLVLGWCCGRLVVKMLWRSAGIAGSVLYVGELVLQSVLHGRVLLDTRPDGSPHVLACYSNLKAK